MLDLILFEYERGVYQVYVYTKRGLQFSCQLIAGRNVKDLSLENVYLIFLVRKLIPKGLAVQLPPNNRLKGKGFITGIFYLILFKYESLYQRDGSSAATSLQIEMLRTYYGKTFYLDCKLCENKC